MTQTNQHYNSGVAYGVTVYWCTIVGAVIVLLGSVLALALGWTATPVEQQFSLVLQGQSLVVNMKTMSADGVILIGLTLAIVSLVPAIMISLPNLWRPGHRWVAVFGAANALSIAAATAYAFY